ncbi:kinase-like protein [Xylariaceae sp. FL0255]|nr:kinase-like protein [Xylariaceae sp. FL0255]
MAARQPQLSPEHVFIDPTGQQQPPSADSHAILAFQDINRQHAQSNCAIYPSHDDDDGSISRSSRPPTAYKHNDFEIHTISPSPKSEKTIADPPSLHDSSSLQSFANNLKSPKSSTDLPFATPKRSDSLSSHNDSSEPRLGLILQQPTATGGSLAAVSRTPSWKQHFAKGIGSAASSVYNSPIITAMGDVTPLPSPLLSSDSPGPWRRGVARPPSRELALPIIMPDSVLITKSGESVAAAIENQMKRKVYAGLTPGHAAEQSNGKAEHARNRSISEYVPDPKGIPRRQNTVSTGKADERNQEESAGLRREPNLSESRGLTSSTKPPTPPPSESSQSNDKKRTLSELFEARGRKDHKLRRWRGIKDLGEGTFSRVVLATSQVDPQNGQPEVETASESKYDRKTLVAIKICEHGPKGGASEDRIEMSLKRELDIMQSIDHPSLVHLKAWSIEPTRALLVLNYCPGGDLFDVASSHRDSLTTPLLQRMFSELVGAVRYLHHRRIVHRDIKLENVLVNVPSAELTNKSQDWATYPFPVVTLTDLGLSRRVADDEKLETRCGSDDYAAPEVILGQPYDGHATDAWSLGVLLYALIESRLPFDPPPGASDYQRMRSRTSHRIARVEWSWIKYAGDDGDHDANIALFEKDGLKGAMEITEGLLRRSRNRWSMNQVVEQEWVRNAMQIEGDLRFREEQDGQEVL